MAGGFFLFLNSFIFLFLLGVRSYVISELKKDFYGVSYKLKLNTYMMGVATLIMCGFLIFPFTQFFGNDLFIPMIKWLPPYINMITSPFSLYYGLLFVLVVMIPMLGSVNKRIILRYEMLIISNYLVILIGSIYGYSSLIYPNLSAVIAGGKPTRAILTLDNDIDPSLRKRLAGIVSIVRKTDRVLYVTSCVSTGAIEVKRDRILAIDYSITTDSSGSTTPSN